MVRWLSGVLVKPTLAGERERARVGGLFVKQPFAGDRDRMPGAVFSFLQVLFVAGPRWSTSLALPREKGSLSSSVDRLGRMVSRKNEQIL